ncbi:hypothetical protein D3C84_1062600 [compost metagenome]
MSVAKSKSLLWCGAITMSATTIEVINSVLLRPATSISTCSYFLARLLTVLTRFPYLWATVIAGSRCASSRWPFQIPKLP